MGVDGAAKSDKPVGNSQTDNLYKPFIFGKTGDQRVIVADGPKQITGAGL